MVSWDWGRLVRDEESTTHADVRLVVFHHRGRIHIAGDEPIAARAARWIGAGTVGGGSCVFAVWLDVVGEGVEPLPKSRLRG